MMPALCECGCGGVTNQNKVGKFNRFIFGHYWRGRHHTPETCANISRKNIGVKVGPPSSTHREALSQALMGKNQGRRQTLEHIESRRQAMQSSWDGITPVLGTRQSNRITELKFWFWHWAQGGECWMCGRSLTEAKIVVDHNHETGVVRGLAHHNCNLQFGTHFEMFM